MTKPNLQKIVKPYTEIDEAKSWMQVANTLIPLAIICVLSYKALMISFWLSLPLSLLAGLFVVRAFIIMHDCGHGTMFRSKKTRDIMGTITGIIASTPYRQWTREHAAHHQDSGNLDKRGRGDVWTMTLEEYKGHFPRESSILSLPSPTCDFWNRSHFYFSIPSPYYSQD